MPPRETFQKLTASELFCPRCRRSTPVRERLLLVLPGEGEVHDLVCAVCGEQVGTRTEQARREPGSGLLLP